MPNSRRVFHSGLDESLTDYKSVAVSECPDLFNETLVANKLRYNVEKKWIEDTLGRKCIGTVEEIKADKKGRFFFINPIIYRYLDDDVFSHIHFFEERLSLLHATQPIPPDGDFILEQNAILLVDPIVLNETEYNHWRIEFPGSSIEPHFVDRKLGLSCQQIVLIKAKKKARDKEECVILISSKHSVYAKGSIQSKLAPLVSVEDSDDFTEVNFWYRDIYRYNHDLSFDTIRIGNELLLIGRNHYRNYKIVNGDRVQEPFIIAKNGLFAASIEHDIWYFIDEDRTCKISKLQNIQYDLNFYDSIKKSRKVLGNVELVDYNEKDAMLLNDKGEVYHLYRNYMDLPVIADQVKDVMTLGDDMFFLKEDNVLYKLITQKSQSEKDKMSHLDEIVEVKRDVQVIFKVGNTGYLLMSGGNLDSIKSNIDQ